MPRPVDQNTRAAHRGLIIAALGVLVLLLWQGNGPIRWVLGGVLLLDGLVWAALGWSRRQRARNHDADRDTPSQSS